MTAYLDLGDLNPYAVELRYGLEDDQDSHLDRHPLRNACTRGASIRVQVRGQHAPSRGTVHAWVCSLSTRSRTLDSKKAQAAQETAQNLTAGLACFSTGNIQPRLQAPIEKNR